MKRALCLIMFLVAPVVVAINAVYTSPSTALDDAAPSTSQAGYSLTGGVGARIFLCANTGVLDSGEVWFYVQESSTSAWARNADPALTLTIPTGWGQPCITWADFRPAVKAGRAYLRKKNLALDGGTAATLRVNYEYE